MEASEEKLIKAWPIVKWLDHARWSTGTSDPLIPGPVFASDLKDNSSKILTHWLCYITDQQRPWQDVWQKGGPVFAEIVQQYKTTEAAKDKAAEKVLGLLKTFTESRKKGEVDMFKSLRQKIQGQKIVYTPRFGANLLSIARTLYILTAFQNNIICYLSDNDFFILRAPSSGDDSFTRRLVFLLYTLSYDSISNDLTSVRNQREQFAEYFEQRCDNIIKLLQEAKRRQELGELEKMYQSWLRQKRFHKRLWASFRDYVKPGSYYEPVFTSALEEVKADSLRERLLKERKQVLCSLELPGDTWNTVFNQKLFDNKINSPKDLREFYDRLRSTGRLSDEFYPEQFDVSFDFARKMCNQNKDKESLCPFKGGLNLKRYCLGQSGNGKLCPVTNILCGYKSECVPSECPIWADAMEDICSGCGFKIELVEQDVPKGALQAEKTHHPHTMTE